MTGSSIREKALFELREFCILAIYLWVCFSAVIFYKYTLLQTEGIAYWSFGAAAIKAAVSAKFLMLGPLLGLTRARVGERLLVTILRKALALLVLLVALTMIEEAVLAAIHGRSVSTALADIGGSSAMQSAAAILIMLLVLIPYVGLQSLSEVMGEGVLYHLFVGRQNERKDTRG